MANLIDEAFLALPRPVRRRLWGKFLASLATVAVFSFVVVFIIKTVFDVGWVPLLVEWALFYLLAGAANAYIGGDFINQMQRLQYTAERLSGGDFGVNLRSRRIDEVGQFYGTLADMRDSLQCVQEIDRATNEQADAVHTVVAATEDVTEISEATSERVDAVTGAVDTQQRAVEEAASVVDRLVDRSGTLQSTASSFETGSAGSMASAIEQG